MLTERIDKLKKMLIENMLDYCFEGYIEKKAEKLEQVLALELVVDRLDNDIDELCMSLIALHNPECKNLRTIMAVLKINIDLERMGDLATNIARGYQFLMQKPFFQPVIDLAKLAKDTKQMLQNAMNAFIYDDHQLAAEVRERDEVIDRLHDKIFRFLMENVNITTEVALYMNSIAKNYERIADLSTNIAENTIFVCRGNNVKHEPILGKAQNKES